MSSVEKKIRIPEGLTIIGILKHGKRGIRVKLSNGKFIPEIITNNASEESPEIWPVPKGHSVLALPHHPPILMPYIYHQADRHRLL